MAEVTEPLAKPDDGTPDPMVNPNFDPMRNIGAFGEYLNSLPPARKAAIKSSLQKAFSEPNGMTPSQVEAIRKDATNNAGLTNPFGLTTYSLESPALNLWPVVTKFRNLMPRRVIRSTGHNWKRITAIDTADGEGFVAENVDTTANSNAGRAGFMTWNEENDAVTFYTLGLDNYITYQARYAGGPQGGQDFRPDEVVRLATLQATMMREEKAIIGANHTGLGNVVGIVKATNQPATTVGGLTAGTNYNIEVTALNLHGYRIGSKGIQGGVDAPGETSAAAATVIATTAGGNAGDESIAITWTAKAGAVAYNVYCKTGGAAQWLATVTTNYYVIGAEGGGNLHNVADQSGNANAFDGLITQFAAKAGYRTPMGGQGSGASLVAATWTGTNTSVDQIDTLCRSLFTTCQVGPTEIFVSPADRAALRNIIVGSTAPLMRVDVQAGSQSITGGLQADAILNIYTGTVMKLTTHPYLPPGTSLFWCSNLGEYYPNVNIPNPVEMLLGFDYLSVDWAPTSLRQEFGVYLNGAPAIRASFPLGILSCTGQ